MVWQQNPAAGWYPDPAGGGGRRYWDGAQWTLHVRRRGVPRGLWYFVVPVLTFGWLSAVPFLHAGSRLRDRRVLLLAGVYAAGGAVAFTLLALAPVDAQGDPDWRGDVGLGLGVVLAGSACVLLIRIRRRVFSAPTAHNGALHPAPHDDRAEVTSPEDVPPVTWAELPRVPPEDPNQEAPSTTQDAQPQATAVAPGRTPWEQGEVTSPAGGGLPPKAASPALGTTLASKWAALRWRSGSRGSFL